MRRTAATLTALTLALLAPMAHATDELHLRWDACSGDGGTYNKTFACDVNTGTDVLVASYRLDSPASPVAALEAGISIGSVGAVIPSWWQFKNTGTCRATSLALDAVPPPTAANCLDLWGGNAAGGIAQYTTGTTAFPPPYTNSALVKLVLAVPEAMSFTVPANQEVFAFRLVINHARTVGSPSCAGCGEPMCLGFSYASLTPTSGTPRRLISGEDTPLNGSRATWQPGGSASAIAGGWPTGHSAYGWVVCEAATPVRDRTWGTIKSLYR